MRARFEAEGDVIAITGGASGIGRALALAAAKAGARVVVLDIDASALATLAKAQPQIVAKHLDVADRTASSGGAWCGSISTAWSGAIRRRCPA